MTETVKGRIGDYAVLATAEPRHRAMLEDVLNVVAQMARRQPLRPGARIRFGWSLLRLVETAPGELTTCEPDFDGNPLLDARPRLDTTLDVAAEQAAFVRQLHITPSDILFEQFIVAGKGALTAHAVQLYRDANASGDDSGWSLTEQGAEHADDGSDAWDAVRVYALLRLRRSLLRLLVLPPGFVVTLEGDQVTRVLDSRGQPVPP